MIGITTQLFDLLGGLMIPSENIKNRVNRGKARRASSVKTLDGGSYTLDFGYSVTDDNLILEFINLDNADVSRLERMIELHSRIWICSAEGAFLCLFKGLKKLGNSVRIDIIIIGNA